MNRVIVLNLLHCVRGPLCIQYAVSHFSDYDVSPSWFVQAPVLSEDANMSVVVLWGDCRVQRITQCTLSSVQPYATENQ